MAARKYFQAQGTLNDATLVALKAAVTGKTIYVQKITLSIVTHANAKFVAVQDDTGTPIVLAKHNDLTAAAGVPSVVTWDFGKRGLACGSAKALNCVSEASGVAGKVYAEGYTR